MVGEDRNLVAVEGKGQAVVEGRGSGGNGEDIGWGSGSVDGIPLAVPLGCGLPWASLEGLFPAPGPFS